MPRRRPRQVRAELAVRRRCRKNDLDPIDGVSRSTLNAIVRIEETRNYLCAGDVSYSLRQWRTFVRGPAHRLWDPDYPRCTEWLCCGDPRSARDILEAVMLALPRSAARELRVIVAALDEMY